MLRAITILCLATAVLGNPVQSASNVESRIVGGDDAKIEDLPYQLSLNIGGLFECGAIIISPLWALTAAQCAGGSINNMQLRAGSVEHVLGANHTVVQKVVHLNYDPATNDFDIALLRVSNAFPIDGTTVASIALPDFGYTLDDGTPTIVSGWGITLPGGIYSSKLKQAEVPSVDDTNCKSIFGSAITKNMICAGIVDEGGIDACQGDAGGPLVEKDSDPKLLVGIVSWGRGCGLANSPHVYTNVAEFRGWILTNSGV